MEKRIKRRIKNTWRNRLLLGASSLAALGFSIFQLHAILKYQSRDLPSWASKLAQSTEILKDEERSEPEKNEAISEILRISAGYDLKTTIWLLKNRNEPHSKPQARELILAVARAQARKQALLQFREPDPDLALEMILDLNQRLSLYQALDRDLKQALIMCRTICWDLGLDREQRFELERNLEWNLEHIFREYPVLESLNLEGSRDIYVDLEQRLSLYQALSWSLEQSLDLAWTLKQILTQEQSLRPDLDLEQLLTQARDLGVRDLSSAAQLTDEMFLVLIIAADLKQTHNLTLPISNSSEKLVDEESARTRALIQSGILFGI